MNKHSQRRSRRNLILFGLAVLGCAICVILASTWDLDQGESSPAGDSAAQSPIQNSTPSINQRAPGLSIASKNVTSIPPPTKAPLPRNNPTAQPTISFRADPASVLTHFILGRPVGPNATSVIPDWTYLYGDTQGGNFEVHHGEEFENPIGTPVLAAADGTVVTAGDDEFPLCGPNGDQVCGEFRGYYGNLVVLKLDRFFENQPVFALCGHMNSVGVQVAQHVKEGDPIGTIGMSGVAVGPHCHFEVRLGVNDYYHTRNPILWMKPLSGRGAVAGSVLDSEGNFMSGLNVYVYLDDATEDWVMNTETYGRDQNPPVNSDSQLRENWAMGDLPAGRYIVRAQVGQINYYQHITIGNGQLTFVTFREE